MSTYPPSKISEIVKLHTKTLEKGLKSQMKIMEKEIIGATNMLLQEQNIEEDKISPIVANSHMENEREYDDDKLEKAESPIRDEASMKTKFTEAINKKDAKGKKKKIKKKDKSKKKKKKSEKKDKTKKNKIKKKKKEKKKIKKKEKLKKKKSVKKNKKHKK